MDDFPPLAALAAFKDWQAGRSWGPDGRWTVTMGGGVIDDLVRGLRAHPADVHRRLPRKSEPYPLVLGCVPWLTSSDVIDTLLEIGHCCIVLDKSAQRRLELGRLQQAEVGVLRRLIPGLAWMRPRGQRGEPPIITPGEPEDDHIIGPLRVLGWRRRGSEIVPLLHAKLAVCCAVVSWEIDTGEGTFWEDRVQPLSVWMGSANWTFQAMRHIEVGAWTADPLLAQTALEFIASVIEASEPFDAAASTPTPELVAADWDDDAFAELAAEMKYAEMEWRAQHEDADDR